MAQVNPVDLNVGGVCYTTSLKTLMSAKESLLASYFCEDGIRRGLELAKDSQGRVFIDRDGVLFRYILDYLRNKRLILPDTFCEITRLKNEAEFYRLPELVKVLETRKKSTFIPSASASLSCITKSVSATEILDLIGTITVGYRGTFAFGRDGLADVKFRKLCRILVHGKVTLCRSVFREALNENRDADRGDCDRYSSRFYLKHNFLEQAFDNLLDAGFELKGSCGTGTNTLPQESWQHQTGGNVPLLSHKGPLHMVSQDSEEGRWYHYNEFIWVKST